MKWIGLLCGLALMSCAETRAPLSSTSPIVQQVASGQIQEDTGLSGWREAVITTAQAERWIDFLTEQAGWEIRGQAPIDQGLKELWDLPDNATGQDVLLANTGADRGFIRLVELQGVDQRLIRSDTRPWDTGGHFDMNMRVIGLNALRERMLADGWHGDSEPVDFTFGPFEVREWIAQGPDGVRLALIERLKPELEGWPDLKIASRTFNATQTVADMAAARHFFETVLGMETYLEHIGPSSEVGPNVLGLPENITTQVPRDVRILHPQGINDGSIELLTFEGASGRDVSALAHPSNLGLSALRFEVDDLDQTTALLSGRGAEFETEIVTLRLAVHGAVRMVTLKAPEGARLELYERLEE